jgi:DNA polymerase I-like protein with 3'-5' exonuclease and polymerase domains
MYNESFVDEHIINDVIHARFWQCAADTGRFTSSDPNLQQVPRDSRWVIGNKLGISSCCRLLTD